MERHFLPHGIQEFKLAGNSRADLDHSGRRTRRGGIKGTSHGRHNLKAVADDDSLPVMVPRNDKTVVPISRERVRRLRKHLIVILRELRIIKDPQHSVSPLRPEPEGFAARVTRTALFSLQGMVLYQRSGSCISGINQRFRVCAAQGCRWMYARCCGYISSKCRRSGTRVRAFFTENRVVPWTGLCDPILQ
jgi:hypothetical protein